MPQEATRVLESGEGRQEGARSPRPKVRGKFLYVGDEKLFVRGVTYGTFRPDDAGDEFHSLTAKGDVAAMAAVGMNALRTYLVPPRWFLDLAHDHGVRVMVDLPWEQHVTFLDDKKRAESIEERVVDGVRACAGHPAVLCYSIGNEIPSSIVRWYGPRQIERYLERLYHAAKEADPEGLVTYVNYPSTEYLELPFLDVFAFNVYLESQQSLERYFARLHNLAGDRPVLMAELGLDSRRHGKERQAEVLAWQIRTTFASGCAGAFIFSWTDEWYRGGNEIENWEFGLTGRDRTPKPALASVVDAFEELPLELDDELPRISVVVCTYNGAQTLRQCLMGIEHLEYPGVEVIVVDDGSTDSSASITEDFDVRLISTPNRGLSSARNTGWRAATGEIVAFIDDDAWPDPHWLTYLAHSFRTTSYTGFGGPNIPPLDDGKTAECVANAPGGPVHVLVTDREAEHIPGCNMAFRRNALEAVEGFDPQFRIAGDDVDLCWRLQERGWKLGFNPAAVVWHRRRNSFRAYLRQQRGYGAAERLLERKWPQKYNRAGHVSWNGRLYGDGVARPLRSRRGRIRFGVWGGGLFQSLYEHRDSPLRELPAMPEWYFLIISLASLTLLGAFWKPLLLAAIPLGLAICLSVALASLTTREATFIGANRSRRGRVRLYVLTWLLHLIQPVARLWGRSLSSRAAWSHWIPDGRAVLPRSRTQDMWSEAWQPADQRLESLEATVIAMGHPVQRGTAWHRWDLELRRGQLGSARMRLVLEEHGAGRQLVRFRSWPRLSRLILLTWLVLLPPAFFAALDAAWPAVCILGASALIVLLGGLRSCGLSCAAIVMAVDIQCAGDGELRRERQFLEGNGRPVRESLDPRREES